jgi:hypothetical protein
MRIRKLNLSDRIEFTSDFLLLSYINARPCHSSGWLSAAARVQSQIRLCGICGGQSGTRAGFLRVLRCPLPIIIPPTAPH